MKQIIQVAVLFAIIIAILMYLQRNQPGYQEVERKTTTTYKKEPSAHEQAHTATETHITKKEKPTREGGSKITVKEHTKTTTQ